MESRTFDTSTLQELKQAERHQQRLYDKYDKVTVTVIGLSCVKIQGVK